MVADDKIVKKLNAFLNSPDFNTCEFEKLLESLLEQENVKLKILDFKYFSEDRLEYVRQEKIKDVKLGSFERAASWREKELKILKYIEFREQFDIKKSEFHFEEGFLLFFYLGTEINDMPIKEKIKEKFKIVNNKQD